MLIANPFSPKANFWNDDIVDFYASKSSDKKTSFLTWTPDASIIHEQIKWLIENSIEIILSEILPDELPNDILLEEYHFLLERIEFIPPSKIQSRSNDLKVARDKAIITDNIEEFFPNCTKNQISTILNIIEENLDYEVIELNRSNNFENAIRIIQNAKSVILGTNNPVLSHYFEIIRNNHKLNCFYRNKLKAGSPFRYFYTGINYFNDSFFNKKASLRETITFLLKITDLKDQENRLLDAKLFSNFQNALMQKDYSLIQSQSTTLLSSSLYQNKDLPQICSQPTVFSSIAIQGEEKTDAFLISNRFTRRSFYSYIFCKDEEFPSFKNDPRVKSMFIELIAKDFLYKQKHWIWEGFFSSFLKEIPEASLSIIKLIKDRKISFKDDYYGYLGENFLAAGANMNASSEFKKNCHDSAMFCFNHSKQANLTEYSDCYDFVQFLENKPNKINDHFLKIISNPKVNRKKSKALTRLIPLVLDHEELIPFTKDIDLNLIELSQGIWKSFGLNYWDLIFSYEFLKDKKDILNRILNLLTHFTPDKENFSIDMVMLSIFLGREQDFPSKVIPNNYKFEIAYLHKLCGNIEYAEKLIKAIDKDSNDLTQCLMLLYYNYILGFYERSKDIAKEIKHVDLECKISADKDWQQNLSNHISLYYKLMNNYELSDKFYRISESFNVGHHFLDFSFRK